MPVSRDLKAEVAFVANLKQLVTAYEQIAVMRIDRVRKSVLAARIFREGLSEVANEVRIAHQKQISALRKKREKISPPKKASVFISTNTRLSGRVTSIVSQYFVEHLENDTDITILGQVGKEHFLQVEHNRKFTFFSLPSNKPTMEDLQPAIQHLTKYQAVTLYFGRFRNVVQQEPAEVHLGDVTEVQKPIKTPSVAKSRFLKKLQKPGDVSPYIFEPSLEDVLKFFNTQIMAVLVKQTSDEAWLSLLGSRITAMEQASQNVDEKLIRLSFEERRARRAIQNKKQRDLMAGITLWG